MRLLHIGFLFILTNALFAQKNLQLSNQAKISILTCAPGVNELYSYFGHSAFRVKDAKNNIDKVYNYGIFDFKTPNFYLKFCRGQLLYQVVSSDYKYFPYLYYRENRWVKSQTLNLTSQENQQLFDYLEWNVLPENKKYHYDFFFDNCATRIHEVIEKSIGKITFDDARFPKKLSHRNLIHQYLPSNSWAKFGIDLALGAVIDQKATSKQYMFLPNYLYTGMQNSTIKNKKTIAKENYILPNYKLSKATTPFLSSPLVAVLLLVLITWYFTFVRKKTVVWFHVLSVAYGILGIIIFSLWFLTEHSATKTNMNILWANPLLILYPFLKDHFKRVLSVLGIVLIVAFLTVAITRFQEFNLCFYLLVICLLPVYAKPLLTFKI